MAQEKLALITVTGEYSEKVIPDEILLSFTVQTQHDAITQAKEENRSISAKAIVYLKNNGIDERHIQTRYMNIRPIKRNHNSPVVDHYAASQTIAICIKDLTQYEPIIDALLEIGITQIGTPVFRSTKMKDLAESGRIHALKNAKKKAEAMAAALDQSIGRAHLINEHMNQGPSAPRGAYMESSARMMNDQGPGFAAGELEIRSQVQVSFELR